MAINKFIDEEIIEARLTEMEDELVGQQWMQDFLEKEPVLASFLFSEDIKLLETEEKALYSYMIVAIWSSVAGDHYESAQCEPETIEKIEESTWEIYMGAKGSFRDKMTPFFENFDQEDLLALIEDLLEAEPEETALTKEGKEFIFIKTKTLLEVLRRKA